MVAKNIAWEMCQESGTTLQKVIDRELELKKAMREGASDDAFLQRLKKHIFKEEEEQETFLSQALALYEETGNKYY